jgi:hypothetical protein
VRSYLAWESILGEKDTLNLSPHQVKQAETQKASADSSATARIPEAYQWLLVPVQATPQDPVSWQASRLSGQDALAVRASKKLRNDELLITSLGGTRLRMELDKIPLWRGDHVAIRQLADDFPRYVYLPRLADTAVLLDAIRGGLALLTWEQDTFAYAESFDEATGRYPGLRTGEHVSIVSGDAGLLVRSEVARRQREAEVAPVQPAGGGGTGPGGPPPGGDDGKPKPVGPVPPVAPPPSPGPKRFHGSVVLDPARVVRDAGRIADEVIAHLNNLGGSTVNVTLEIEAEIPGGTPENVVRTVTENSRTLKFSSQGFERE